MIKKIIAWGFAVVIAGIMAFAFITPASATGNPEQTLECEVVGVDYMRPLVNGDHINIEIQRPDGSKYQVNAFVDRNIAGGHDTLGLRINGFNPIPLTKDQIDSGYLVWRYGDYISDDVYRVTFVQTNSTDTWPDKDCPEVPPTEEPEPTTPTATVTVTIPGDTITEPGETVTIPSETVTVPGDTETVYVPGETVTETVKIPGTTVTRDGETIVRNVPGDTETVYINGSKSGSNVPGYVNAGMEGQGINPLWTLGIVGIIALVAGVATLSAKISKRNI